MVRFLNLLIKLTLMVAVAATLIVFTKSRIEYYKTKPFNDVPITMAEREKQLNCLAKNIYYEAGNEPFEGKVAVAQVTINRSNSGRYPSDICDVVYQKNVFYGKVVCQFSWYCENGPKTIGNTAGHRESMEVAKKVLLENFRLPSLKDAYFYHADYVSPNWNKPKIAKIGRHIFYGEKNGNS